MVGRSVADGSVSEGAPGNGCITTVDATGYLALLHRDPLMTPLAHSAWMSSAEEVFGPSSAVVAVVFVPHFAGV
jgi:hypothetical protein